MPSIFANWKTSAAGLAAIAMNFLPQIIPSLPPQYAAIASGVLAGLGLIFAKDSTAK